MYSISHANKDYKKGKFENGETINFSYPCSSQTECSPYIIRLSPGAYFLEAYGAQGQSTVSGSYHPLGGYGGYSCGVYTSNTIVTIYLHIGGNSQNTTQASYNGGGSGNNEFDGAGGGATDFRLGKGEWNQNFDSRLLVAGGGGGAYAHKVARLELNGGNGGGLQGGKSECSSSNNKSPIGTQTGSIGGVGEFNNGSFGYGASGYYACGGGGYYGGGNALECGGGGGSGFIGNVTSLGRYVAITEESKHTGPGSASITFISHVMCKTVTKTFTFHQLHLFVLIFIGMK